MVESEIVLNERGVIGQAHEGRAEGPTSLSPVTPHLYHAHVSSSPNQDNTYSAGENIEVDLAFSEVVRLADPSYRLPIRFGDTDKYVYAEPVIA